MSAYYNEFDAKAAAWLRELIKEGHIADGEVDERSITDVDPTDLLGFTQCHFFAGIGGWSLALRLAGWPDDRPVWTGSCPCQPFSAAGKRKGTADERHLWPDFFRLIKVCHPSIVLGEQVASKDGRIWLAGIRSEMEAVGYAVGGADLCAAGIGAPNIRQRLWWVADADEGERGRVTDSQERQRDRATPGRDEGHGQPQPSRANGGVGNTDNAGPQGRTGVLERADQRPVGAPNLADRVADTNGGEPRQEGEIQPIRDDGQPEKGELSSARGDLCGLQAGSGDSGPTGQDNGFWGNADWLLCRDGKWRKVEPGTSPLADGVPARVGRLRGYGNAINPWVAAEFIKAYEEARQ